MQEVTIIDECDLLKSMKLPIQSHLLFLYCRSMEEFKNRRPGKHGHWIIDICLHQPDKRRRYDYLSQEGEPARILVINSQVDLEMLGRYFAAAKDETHITIGNLLLAVKDLVAQYVETESDLLSDFKGGGREVRKTYQLADLVATTNYAVILYGETGTGKEVLAHYIHRKSHRRNKPFIAIDCGCINKEIAGSELFGHIKGAFTDAGAARKGAFEVAHGGTLFLDEIGNLPYEVQILLLRAIQEKKIRRVGAAEETAVDVRIIAASNESLSELCRRGAFREDLYYRLNELLLVIPPLRERKEDLLPLAIHFLKQSERELNKAIDGFTGDAIEALRAYHWPGNIRELRNVLKKAALLTPNGAAIDKSVLPIPGNRPEPETPEPVAVLKDAISLAEAAAILDALRKTEYNKKKAAVLLNIHRKTLYNKLKLMKMI